MDVKGQGALEYLLLIGGAVLVAAIVIALVTGIPTTTPDPVINPFSLSFKHASANIFASFSLLNGFRVMISKCRPKSEKVISDQDPP